MPNVEKVITYHIDSENVDIEHTEGDEQSHVVISFSPSTADHVVLRPTLSQARELRDCLNELIARAEE